MEQRIGMADAFTMGATATITTEGPFQSNQNPADADADESATVLRGSGAVSPAEAKGGVKTLMGA